MSYVLPVTALGYDARVKLRDVTLAEARSWVCNRCGDCCNGLSDGVTKDDATGLPLFVWGARFPRDLYESRYGRRMLQPIVIGDGGPQLGDTFEVDMDGTPHTSFQCAFLANTDSECTTCTLYGNEDPDDLATVRPLNCGQFPIFGTIVDDAIIANGTYVPPTGALPRCTWHGIRIVGPWKDGAGWLDRWERQQRGEPVLDLSLPSASVQALEEKQHREYPEAITQRGG